ncbi:MAG: hypothetical protein P4L40_04200 [Terracidiphilus sp.]|nr:hypothetical protein [Terracidiphilus sp.]
MCSVAKNWIRTVAANYTAFDFFFNRCVLCVFLSVSVLWMCVCVRGHVCVCV